LSGVSIQVFHLDRWTTSAQMFCKQISVSLTDWEHTVVLIGLYALSKVFTPVGVDPMCCCILWRECRLGENDGGASLANCAYMSFLSRSILPVHLGSSLNVCLSAPLYALTVALACHGENASHIMSLCDKSNLTLVLTLTTY